MRWIVIGALAVAVLAIALLLEVMGHSEPARASSVPSSVPHASAPPPPASASADAAPHAEHPVATVDTHAAPALAPAAPAPAEHADPKKPNTPTDDLRWSLMRAVRNSEPAIIECLDRAKAAGQTLDGEAVFAFYVAPKDGKAVIVRAETDASAFPEAVTTCLSNTLASGELDEVLPQGQKQVRVQRELAVEKGAIARYKLKSFMPSDR